MKEPHKIHLRREVWLALTSIAEREGKTLDEVIASLINDKYAWNIPEPPKTDNNNNMTKATIRELLTKLVNNTYLSKIERHEYANYIVLYCDACKYINVISRYSLAEWICSNGHKQTPLGTLNNFI
jgi:predicted nucleic-acid-binding Zn-ribbon protein